MNKTALLPLALLLSLALAAPAAADPVNSPNAQVVEFSCAGDVNFSVVTIAQNQASAVQVLQGASGVFHLTRVVAPDGTVVFAMPGQADKTDVTGCTTPAFPGFVGEGFFAPHG